MQVTMAHEYNHVLQFTLRLAPGRLDVRVDGDLGRGPRLPGTSTTTSLPPAYAGASTVPLTHERRLASCGSTAPRCGTTSSEGTQGAAVIREAWEDSDAVTPAHRSIRRLRLGAGRRRLPLRGDVGRVRRVRQHERRVAGRQSVYPDTAELPDDRARPGSSRTEGRRGKLDHLSYALMSSAPGQPPMRLKLRVRARRASTLRSTWSRVRAPPPRGRSSTAGRSAHSDGQASAVLDPGSYDRVTAVIANADARVSDSGRYTADNSQFAIKLSHPVN